LATADLGEQKRLCAEMQTQLWEDVPFIPLGEYWQASAYRKDLAGIIPGCFATFYGVRRI
jgi:peptide/nickel transport system substrate-binding protein